MKKLTSEQIKKIKNLYRKGKSLNYIANFLKLSKSTVYYYVRKTFGRKIKQVKFNKELKEEFGEILGVFVGDGSFIFDKKYYGYIIQFTLGLNEMAYAKKLCHMIEKVFGKKCYVLIRKNYNTIIVRIKSKRIYEILREYVDWKIGKKTYTIHFKEEKVRDERLLKGILRGLIASDGSIYVPKRKLTYSTVSKKLIKQLSSFYSQIGIENKIYKIKPRKNNEHMIYTIDLYGNEKIRKLINFIGKINNEQKERKIKLILDAPVI